MSDHFANRQYPDSIFWRSKQPADRYSADMVEAEEVLSRRAVPFRRLGERETADLLASGGSDSGRESINLSCL